MIQKIMFGCFAFLLLVFLTLTQYKTIDIRKADFTLQAEIKGEVKQPGVYEITKTTSLAELIEKAGGCTDKADTSTLSMTRRIVHGDVIVVGEYSNQLISINSAPLSELILIPGIGEKKALLIIEYRALHSFTVLEDLMNVKGIGEKSFAKMKDFICL